MKNPGEPLPAGNPAYQKSKVVNSNLRQDPAARRNDLAGRHDTSERRGPSRMSIGGRLLWSSPPREYDAGCICMGQSSAVMANAQADALNGREKIRSWRGTC